MPSIRHGLVAAVLAAHAPSCAGSFACVDDTSCGDGGQCEATGFCSFADEACPSGRRYGEHASESLAGKCVDEPVAGDSSGSATDASTSLTTTTASVTSVDPTTDDPTTGAVSLTSSTTDPTTGGEVTSAMDSTGDSPPVELGPLVIEDDFDDGAMWPSTGQQPGAWFPSGEADAAPGQSFMGEHPNGNAYFGYFRFRMPIALPPGTIVTAAHFELGGWGLYLWSSGKHALRIHVERSPDAPQVESLESYPEPASPFAPQLVDESVRWPEMGGLLWNVVDTNASPQITAPLQALIDGTVGGMAEGAHVQLWIGADDLGGGTREVGWVDSASDENTGSAVLWLEVDLP